MDVSEEGSSQLSPGHHPPKLLVSEEQVRAVGMETVALSHLQVGCTLRIANSTTTLILQDPSSAQAHQPPGYDGQDDEVVHTTPMKKQHSDDVATTAPLTPDPRQRKHETAQTPQPSTRSDSIPEAVPETLPGNTASERAEPTYMSAGLSSATPTPLPEDAVAPLDNEAQELQPVVENLQGVPDGWQPVAKDLQGVPEDPLPPGHPPLETTPRAQSPLTTSTTSCAGFVTDGHASEAVQLLEQLQGVLQECRVLLDHKRARAERYAASLHHGGTVEKLQRRRNKMERISARVHVVEGELQELERFVERTAQHLHQEEA